MMLQQKAVFCIVTFCSLMENLSLISGNLDTERKWRSNDAFLYRGKRSSTCVDKYSLATCTFWKNSGLCSQYKFQTSCMKTCGRCKAPQAVTSKKCADKDQRCSGWLPYCRKSTYLRFMKKNCAKTCGHCTAPCVDKNKTCPRWARMGECSINPRYMLKSCKKSCRVCSKKTTRKPTTATSPTQTSTTSKPVDSVKCGNKAFIGRIVGGKKAPSTSWPWQVGIKSCSNCTFFCGGTIVAKTWVVTAAHCVVNYFPADLHIVAGVTHQGKVTKHQQSFKCTKIHTHQNYGIKAPFDEDVALLKLDKEFIYNDHVRPLCLNEKKLKVNEQCVVTGFGKTKENGVKSAYLKEASVPIVDQNVCVQAYRKTSPPRVVTTSMVCAGYSKGKIDACGGDSGGPLKCFDVQRQRYVLAGIVSWGVGCARTDHYGVYTDVKHLTLWIEKYTGKISK